MGTKTLRWTAAAGLCILLLLGFLALPGQARPASADVQLSISGTVTDSSGSGLPGVGVDLVVTGTGVSVASAVTDTSGSYATSVPPGAYDFHFTAPAGSGLTDGLLLNQMITASTVVNIVLTTSGVARVALSGRILAADGTPQTNVEVSATPAPGSPPSAQFALTSTDSQGGYIFGALVPAAYTISARFQVGGRPQLDWSATTQVQVAGATTQNLTLPQVTTLQVNVVDADGNPLSGIYANVHESFAIPEISQGGSATAYNGQTNNTGSVTLNVYAPATTATIDVYDGGNLYVPLHSQPISVDGGPITVVLQKNDVVALSGRILAADGTPQTNVEVSATPAPGSPPSAQFALTSTDSQGGYIFGALVPAAYTISARFQVGGRPQLDWSATTQVQVAGATTQNLTLPQVTTLQVNVVDADGNPLSGIYANVHESFAIPEISQGGSATAYNGQTNNTGSVTLNVYAPATTATIDVYDGGNLYVPLHSQPISVDGGPITVVLQKNDVVALSGRILAADGTPQTNVEVSATPAPGSPPSAQFALTSTDSQGGYIFGALVPAAYTISARFQVGGRPQLDWSATTQVQVAGATTQNLTLPQVTTLQVNVVDADGNPLSGIYANVHESFAIPEISQGGSATAYNGQTNNTGSVTLNVYAPATTATIDVYDGGNAFDPVHAALTIPSGASALTVAVHTFSEVPSAGFVPGPVTLKAPPGTILAHVATKPVPQGELPPGATAPTGSLSYELDGVAPGGTADVVLQLPAGSNPTRIFKNVGGTYLDVTTIATISGDTVTMHLTDGGVGDEDGVGNGVIIDPIVPVQCQRCLTGVTISAHAATLPKGVTEQLTVLGAYSDGSSADLTASAAWTSSATSVATISRGGLVTGTGEGQATITAAVGSLATTTSITVSTPVLKVVAISPMAARLTGRGATLQYTATGTYSDGTTQNLTTKVTWSSSTPSVATITPKGLATASSRGLTTVTAVLGRVTSSTPLTVGPAILTGITVNPTNTTLAKGKTLQYTATGTYSDGTTQNLTTKVTWSSSTPSVATITPKGLATASSRGLTTVTAVLGRVTSSTPLTVGPAILTGITVNPTNTTLAKGKTLQYTATGTYSDGTTQNLTTKVTWSSSTPSVATITPEGLATGVDIGTATVVANLGVSRATARLVVRRA